MSFEEDDPIFIPTQFDDDSAQTLRLKMLQQDQDEILIRYKEELSDFQIAQETLRQDRDEILLRYEEELSNFQIAQDSMKKLKHQKQAELRQDQEIVRQMQEQINIYNTRKANLKFTHERQMAIEMTKWWYFTLIPLYLFMLHFYHKGIYTLMLLNTAGFLAHWRMLYVLRADYTPVFGMGILLISWFLGTNAI